jgi:hypothetical protein
LTIAVRPSFGSAWHFVVLQRANVLRDPLRVPVLHPGPYPGARMVRIDQAARPRAPLG